MGFNKKQIEAILTKNYICPKCGEKMVFEDESESTLVCEHCGHDMDSDYYGLTEEEIDNLYPTEEEVLAAAGEYESDDNECEEIYEEEYNELED